MSDYKLLIRFLDGESPKNFKKLKVTKSKAYKISKRAKFVKPFLFCILNLSSREFSASVNCRYKTAESSENRSLRFHKGAENLPFDVARRSR